MSKGQKIYQASGHLPRSSLITDHSQWRTTLRAGHSLQHYTTNMTTSLFTDDSDLSTVDCSSNYKPKSRFWNTSSPIWIKPTPQLGQKTRGGWEQLNMKSTGTLTKGIYWRSCEKRCCNMVRKIHFVSYPPEGSGSLFEVCTNADTLLFNDQRLRTMNKAFKNEYLSVLQWIWANKPLQKGQDEWIFQPDDFVQISKIDRLQFSLLSYFVKVSSVTLMWRNVAKILQRLFPRTMSLGGDANHVVEHFSVPAIEATGRFLNILLTVGILIIPVFLLLWIPMTQGWIAATVLLSVLAFSMFMSLFTKAEVQSVLVGTAA